MLRMSGSDFPPKTGSPAIKQVCLCFSWLLDLYKIAYYDLRFKNAIFHATQYFALHALCNVYQAIYRLFLGFVREHIFVLISFVD